MIIFMNSTKPNSKDQRKRETFDITYIIFFSLFTGYSIVVAVVVVLVVDEK